MDGEAPDQSNGGVVFVGYGLGLHEHTKNGQAYPVERVPGVAESGALAVGAVPFAVVNPP